MKNILLAVCGLSPQVITETLFALHQNGRLVDCIHIITTHDGKKKIFGSLLENSVVNLTHLRCGLDPGC